MRLVLSRHRLRSDCITHDEYISTLFARYTCDVCGYFDPGFVVMSRDGIRRCLQCRDEYKVLRISMRKGVVYVPKDIY